MTTTLFFTELDSWLKAQPENTINDPYKLNIIDDGTSFYTGGSGSNVTKSDLAYVLLDNLGKFVDLSATVVDSQNASATVSGNVCRLCEGCTNVIVAPVVISSNMYSAFSGCTNLKRVPFLGNTISGRTSAWFVFDGCTSLEEITECTLDPTKSDFIPRDFFYGAPDNLKIYVPEGYKELWREGLKSTSGTWGNITIRNIIERGTKELITLSQLKEYDRVRAAKTEEALQTKQDNLVSGTNIKTVNGNSLLGSGNLEINTIPTGGTEGQVLTSNGDGTISWKTSSAGFIPPVGMVVELDGVLNPNDLFTGDWIELQENK